MSSTLSGSTRLREKHMVIPVLSYKVRNDVSMELSEFLFIPCAKAGWWKFLISSVLVQLCGRIINPIMIISFGRQCYAKITRILLLLNYVHDRLYAYNVIHIYVYTYVCSINCTLWVDRLQCFWTCSHPSPLYYIFNNSLLCKPGSVKSSVDLRHGAI